MPLLSTIGGASAKGYGFRGKKAGAVGQIVYTATGSYSWTVPSGVAKISVVYINGGYRGGQGVRQNGGCYCCCTGLFFRVTEGIGGSGGSGGSLYYKNCYSVTAGQVFTITVGNNNGGGSSVTIGGSGIGSTASYSGGGGGSGGYNAVGGWNQAVPYTAGGGGGGAGGYTAAGSGGGYASGVNGPSTSTNGTTPGGSPSGGGGGAGGYATGYTATCGSFGACGAVRIVWTYTGGPTRAFPATNVGDL